MPTFPFPKFTGGYSHDPAKPNECAQFDNVDVSRDGYSATRIPSFLLHTTGGLDGTMCTGVGRAVCPAGTAAKLLVAKSSSVYYTNINTSPNSFQLPLSRLPLSFSSFTLPSSTDDYPTYFVTMLNASFIPTVYVINLNQGGVVAWNGSSGSSAVVSGSPANPFLGCSYNNHLYVVSSNTPNILQFSDTANPGSWPSTNQFQIDASYGQIVALVAQDDRLYIFTEQAILYMVGDPTTPYVGVMHPYVTCVSQSSISQFGSMCVFWARDNNFYSLAGGVNLVSDSIRGTLLGGYDVPGDPLCGWAALTPNFFFLRSPQNAYSGSPKVATTNGNESYILANERQRYGYWGRYTYPTLSGIGASDPWQAVIFYVTEWQALVVPTGNGDVYIQPLMDAVIKAGLVTQPYSMDANSSGGLNGAVPVTSTIVTMATDIDNDVTLTKLFRQGRMFGIAYNAQVLMTLIKGNTTATVANVKANLSSTTGPFQWVNTIDGTAKGSSKLEFNMIQFTLSAYGLKMVRFEFDYTPQRRSFIY